MSEKLVVKLYSHKIFSYVFCVRKYFYNEKKQITVHVCGPILRPPCLQFYKHSTPEAFHRPKSLDVLFKVAFFICLLPPVVRSVMVV